MNVNGVSADTNSVPISAALDEKQLDRDTFLQLLLTQLSNQDPLEPVSNQDFIAQLAQFSSLEQLSDMSSSLRILELAQFSSLEQLSDMSSSLRNLVDLAEAEPNSGGSDTPTDPIGG